MECGYSAQVFLSTLVFLQLFKIISSLNMILLRFI
jgi:hypothetical protein